ncbi:MAG: GGDEF and EAL domain-containing protein [Planctomycetota bacterium]
MNTPNAREAEERLEVIWSGARDGLWDWDLAADRLRLSARWRSIAGLAEEDAVAAPPDWFALVHAQDVDGLKAAIRAHLAGETPHLEHEFRLRHADGGWRWVLCRAAKHPTAGLLGGSLTDVTARRAIEDRLRHQLAHDPLTGLPNRALFLDRLAQSLLRTRRPGGSPVAVLHLDLDRFHHVNDSLGVEAGDALLLDIAGGISSLMRLGDTFARLEGDKFGIILDGVRDGQEAVALAEEIGAVLRRPRVLRGHEIICAGSIGIAVAAHPLVRAEDLLRDAMSAMHRAKQDSATLYEIYDPELSAKAKERLRLEGDLHHALERRELVLHYQPIVSFATGRLSGFEALLRWQHPVRGLVRPDRFIPLAEENGLIVPMGKWVLVEACRQMEEWRRGISGTGDLAMAVNLSARQFEDPDLVNEVAGALECTGLSARGLKLEMTESVVMARTRENAATLQALRDLGVRLLIDDFGTGYSSLASLHSFPLDSLKIDRSFVCRMEFEEEKAEIVRIILALAAKLGLDVVAEGVETAEELRMLRDLACQHGQGYFFSTALDRESASAWIRDAPVW